MSYGAVVKQAARYREAEVLSATPGKLLIIVFDHLLVNLRRSRLLRAESEGVARSDALERARAAVTELLVTLDRERGGTIAANLASLYVFILSELSVLGVKPDHDRCDALIAMLTELRDAFAQGMAVEAAAASLAVS